jgi:Uma2 family endonuclease
MAVADLKTPAAIRYPETDGKPMGETDIHIAQIIDLLFALTRYFREDPRVYVAADLLLYYVEGDPKEFVVPDVFVVRGVPKGERRIYKLWEEGRAPDVVFEITSASTRREDLGTKRVLYADLGVKEYFVFDPTGEDLRPPLRAFRLSGSEYQPLKEPVFSEVLGLELQIVDKHLRLFDPRTGKRLLTPAEADAAREAAEAEVERLRAELEKLKGKA